MTRNFEQLESRRLMAGDFMMYEPVLISLYQPLVIEGTAYNDSISVSNDGLGNIVVNNNGALSSHWSMWISKVVVNGHAGNDYVSGSWNLDKVMELRGGAGSDTLVGGNLGDLIEGGGETDSVYGQGGNDVVDGGVGGNALWWENTGNDYVSGGAGNDTLHASDSGSCSLYGSDGDDYLYGWAGNDYLSGGAGVDEFHGFTGNDTLVGSTGNDRLWGEDGDDKLYGDWDNDALVGGNGNDSCWGGDGHDNVWGENGNDKLYGNAGDDLIFGGWGDDTIVTVGGGVYDRVWGEGGTDSIWTDAEGTEVITDTEPAYNLHRVGGFMTERFTNGSGNSALWTYQTPSRELNGQNFRDPDGGANLVNFSNRPLFNGTNPLAGDVDQNALSDCYFLAPLSSVAKVSPNTIKQSVVELGDGTYAVRYFNGGTANYIRVDGQLPTDGMGNPTNAGLGTGGCTWVAIMEKAWAHFRTNEGTWTSTEWGWMSEAYSALGSSTSTLGLDWWYKLWNGSDSLWQDLCNRLTSGQSVTVATHATPVAGLVGRHAYMVDTVYMVGTTRYVRLRNPHGSAGAPGAYVTFTAGQIYDSISTVQSAYV